MEKTGVIDTVSAAMDQAIAVLKKSQLPEGVTLLATSMKNENEPACITISDQVAKVDLIRIDLNEDLSGYTLVGLTEDVQRAMEA